MANSDYISAESHFTYKLVLWSGPKSIGAISMKHEHFDIHYVSPSQRDGTTDIWLFGFHEEIELFKQQAAGFVAISDRAGLRDLYSQWVAYLLARHKDDEVSVMLAMRQALREVLLQPSRHPRHNRFGDL
jgi:hypothetical protein